MDRVRIGLIGAARVAPYAIVAPARSVCGAELAAIAARAPARAATFAAEHGIATVHSDYDALIADPTIDLVYVATPPATHAAIAHRALDAGKNVLIEKPFALNAAEAAAILDHAQARGLHAFEAMHAPHHALFGKTAAIFASGVLGRVRRISASFSTIIADSPDEFRWNAALGGGALMDLGIYPLALCRRLLGEDYTVDAIAAEFQRGVDVRMLADLRFGEIAVRVGCSMLDPFEARLEVGGEEGTLCIRNPVAPSLGNRLTLRSRTSCEAHEVAGRSSWTGQLAAIVATLIDGAPYPLPADDPLASMRAIDRLRTHPDWAASLSDAATAPPLRR